MQDERPAARTASDGPWWSRLLNERGLATVLAIVLLVAMLWFGKTLLDDMRVFQQQMVVEAARTNDQLIQMQLTHAQIQAQLEQLEQLVRAANALTRGP
jgi:hypothetical protein